MKRATIATRIHRQTGISMEEAAKLLDHTLEILKHILQAGESISLPGFGKFTVRSKRARPGRNPKTGKAIESRPGAWSPFNRVSNSKEKSILHRQKDRMAQRDRNDLGCYGEKGLLLEEK